MLGLRPPVLCPHLLYGRYKPAILNEILLRIKCWEWHMGIRREQIIFSKQEVWPLNRCAGSVLYFFTKWQNYFICLLYVSVTDIVLLHPERNNNKPFCRENNHTSTIILEIQKQGLTKVDSVFSFHCI